MATWHGSTTCWIPAISRRRRRSSSRRRATYGNATASCSSWRMATSTNDGWPTSYGLPTNGIPSWTWRPTSPHDAWRIRLPATTTHGYTHKMPMPPATAVSHTRLHTHCAGRPLMAPPRALPPSLPALHMMTDPISAYVGRIPETLSDELIQSMLRVHKHIRTSTQRHCALTHASDLFPELWHCAILEACR